MNECLTPGCDFVTDENEVRCDDCLADIDTYVGNTCAKDGCSSKQVEPWNKFCDDCEADERLIESKRDCAEEMYATLSFLVKSPMAACARAGEIKELLAKARGESC